MMILKLLDKIRRITVSHDDKPVCRIFLYDFGVTFNVKQ